MINTKKQKQGISLIVLVITIIVVIILSGVIILNLSGTNLIGKAQEARYKTQKALEKEALTFAIANSIDENLDDALPNGWINDGNKTYISSTGNVYKIQNGEEIVDSGNITDDDTLPTGWSKDKNKTYFSSTGNIYKIQNDSKISEAGNIANPDGYKVFEISSQSDIYDAFDDPAKKQCWNIVDDFTISDYIYVHQDSFDLIINGNNHTIYGSNDEATTTSSASMFNFVGVGDNDNYFRLFNINLVSGEHYRYVFQFVKNDSFNANPIAMLSNVSIDHSKGLSLNNKYGAAIVCNSSDVKVYNNFSITSGERAWAAIDLDNSIRNVSFTFAKNASISMVDNRSQDKKDSEPFIGFSNENSNNTISFVNNSSFVMTSVIKNGKSGYDLISNS